MPKSFFRDSSSSSSSGSEGEGPPMRAHHSPQARCEDANDDDDASCTSPPPSYTATPEMYMRGAARQQHHQQQQHHRRQGTVATTTSTTSTTAPSTTVLNLISAAAAYKSIITNLDTSAPAPAPAPIPSPPTSTAMIPTPAAAPPLPSPNPHLHHPTPLRPLRSVRQLEPPAPAPTNALARRRAPHPTILTPHPFIRALAARLVAPELVGLYFADFHYCWPMLHRGRFLERLDEQPVELVWSVGLVGSMFLDQHGEASPSGRAGPAGAWGREGSRAGGGRAGTARRQEEDTFRSAAREWRVEDSCPGDETSAANFVVAQALLLNIIYGICVDQTSLRLRITSSLSTLIEWVREAGLFHRDQILSQHDNVSSSSSSCSSGLGQGNDSDHERWLELEAKKRLSMSIFRLDTYLSIIHDRAPSIRFQEVRVPLQCTLALWDAYTVDDWRRARLLEPNGRLHKTFSSICATAASSSTRQTIPVLLEEDFELGLCAMQARLWEDTQQRHEEFGNSTDAYDYGGGGGGGAKGGIVREGRMVENQEVGPNDLIAQEFVGFGEGWHAQLEHWRVHRERCQQVNAGYAPPAHWRRTRFNTSMLYFLSYVRMHADVVVIRRLSSSLGRERSGRTTPASMSSMTNRRLENRVHAWAGSRNARIALRYAAQMFRLYAEEVDLFASTFQRIDPFSVGCMFRAALVVWAYTRSNLVCELCSDISPENPEDPGTSSPFFGPRVVCELAEIWGPVDSEYINSWILNGGKASMNGNLLCACGLPQLIDAFVIVMRRGSADSKFVDPLITALENLKYCR
ncbi:hypothetical protein SLS56_004385 [Neofusicoccum ribis]|uniref:Xylanolytic transcriptional activator regulatory domain-containing protein n=1 Tax=Neofusicoccum ribis TaxID=45134 RepID=A0ABR3SYA8_9PEZI